MIEQNKYIASFIKGIIIAFRAFHKEPVTICIRGMKKIVGSDVLCLEFINYVSEYGFNIVLDGEDTCVSCIDVICNSNKVETNFKYHLNNLTLLLEISSKSEISLFTLLVMKVISTYISQTKTIYKAFALDLDDTLWKGTLSEDGLSKIEQNLRTEDGKPFIRFMNFICSLAKELGVFIAICTRNESSLVKTAIDRLDETIFPLKNQIDCIVANNNDKSGNLIKVAEQLSILPNAIIFIDDNGIIRDEVREKEPQIFVPEWIDHDDLILQLEIGGYFDRLELSLTAQNKRRNYRIIKEERINNSLPNLNFKVREDKEHTEAQKLYAKSNQFKLNQLDCIFCQEAKSLCFELFRKNGESLGICSCVTYFIANNECVLLNWAVSCRFFEIGVEESVLIYMLENIHNNVIAVCQFNDNNQKVEKLMKRYFSSVVTDGGNSVTNIDDRFIYSLPYNELTKNLLKDINSHIGEFNLYFIGDEIFTLSENTNLKISYE